MKIILLRHGETIWNAERRLQGVRDIPLAEAGVRQMTATGEHLAQTFADIDLILTSPLQRAVKSAEIVAGKLGYPTENILAEPLFLERSFGVGEGMTYEEALAVYPDSDYPEMELLPDLIHRANDAITKCIWDYSGQNLLVIAHGAIIKAVLVALTEGRIGYFDENVWIENASYCVLDYDGRDWKLSFHNASDGYEGRLL